MRDYMATQIYLKVPCYYKIVIEVISARKINRPFYALNNLMHMDD
jgi:hypothetical protein